VNGVPLIDGGKPIRTVLRWQVYVTAASLLIAGLGLGLHGALSALAGGLINILAGTVFGVVATRSSKRTVGEALIAMMRAEAAKVMLIVAQLWVVLVNYKQLVLAPFFGTFIVTVIFFSMAIFVRER
jgi:ATP synthase protein I